MNSSVLSIVFVVEAILILYAATLLFTSSETVRDRIAESSASLRTAGGICTDRGMRRIMRRRRKTGLLILVIAVLLLPVVIQMTR